MNPALIMSIVQLIAAVAQRPGSASGVNQVLATVGTLQTELSTLFAQISNARNSVGAIDAAGWDAVHAYVSEQRTALDKSLGLTTLT